MPHISFAQGLFLYLIAINLITFCLYGIDKRRAIRQHWRIPERTLILFAVIGGSIGALIGMFVFHHKTRHPKFFIGVPLILFLQIAIPLFLLLKH